MGPSIVGVREMVSTTKEPSNPSSRGNVPDMPVDGMSLPDMIC